MTDRQGGDGDLDVDAAWAEIVARWEVDGDDLRVVKDGGEPQHPEGAADDARPDGDEQPEVQDEAAGTAVTDRPTPAAAPPVARPEPEAVHQVPVPLPPAREDRRARDEDDDPALAALDEHFVPPDPGPFGVGDPLTTLAWLGALGGPLFLLVAALAWRDAPAVLIGAAVLAFVGGFVTLVVRMPDRDEDDDGAEV